ncbi:hypothetical protein ABH930_007267 [Kitasatospora sp. GAS204A]|uniref:hypothetical protein n=1 Tax=unclassified Kitasatospora TaxID=2633591 RepID=UPI002474FBEA|nr:hypothetical protein [Kitasatospora sp. GAS204B]MDH6122873.1 hypothetical protein [Kitasatospora sp. GAS204B]
MIVLDSGAVRALSKGHRGLQLLVDKANASPFTHLVVPVLCLLAAEDEGAGLHVLSLPAVEVEPLDSMAAVTVATIVRDGIGSQDTAHALYAALPTGSRGAMHLILTAREDDYPPGTVTVDINDDRLLG